MKSNPCFLVAPMNRSGTKFFKSLLLGHETVSQGFSLEDYGAAYSDHLIEYSKSACKHWGRGPEDQKPQQQRLLKMLGECLIDFFAQGASSTRYLLLTTPRPWGISNIWEGLDHNLVHPAQAAIGAR
ncbi:hypothetical protein Thiowin_02700 [Thiorhodovibrio winogradskyi]|uniref:Sulfotransferase family protein n=1 Tax=Thiorhodovibrio winogradskyi TaxID=77007 RepID=A0ABZ0SDK2_9GAMM|nr:hypothetical protein [Thiorhodovibrio winogradskyi]